MTAHFGLFVTTVIAITVPILAKRVVVVEVVVDVLSLEVIVDVAEV